MAEMPNPFVSSSVDTGVSAETPVVASPSPQAQGAAAGCHLSDPTSSTGGHQGSPASPQEPDGAGDLGLDCIGEIFAGASKLEPVEMWFENTAYPCEDELLFDVLVAMVDPNAGGIDRIPDEEGFMLELDEAPLFLRQAI